MTFQKLPATMRVIIIDDDEKLSRLIADYLEPMNFSVDVAHDGPQGLQMIADGNYHAVILDVMMPGMDGFEVLRELRKFSDVPVLMLTARDEETDRIVGLEMGADDYLPKTFSSRELLARLRAATRRYQVVGSQEQVSEESPVLTFEQLEIDQDSRTVHLNKEALNLTPLEYDLLLSLAKAACRVLSREQLLDAIAGRNYEIFDRSIDVHISSLRRKLGENPRHPRFIKTIRSVGYMFLIKEGCN